MGFLASLFGVCSLALAANGVAQTGNRVSYQWDLAEFYATLEDWEQAMAQLEQRIEVLL